MRCLARHLRVLVSYWLSDVVTSGFAKAIQMDTARTVRHVQATDSLEGLQILEVVQRHGWVTDARRSYITDMGFAMERVWRMLGIARNRVRRRGW
jgi:hypothetical protein